MLALTEGFCQSQWWEGKCHVCTMHMATGSMTLHDWFASLELLQQLAHMAQCVAL